jgi:uncharacterized protein (DUF697 family)
MATESTGPGTAETRSSSETETVVGSEPPVTDENRDAIATKLVERFALWSGVAGLVPVPFIDVVAVGGLQLEMLRRLSQLYGVPFSSNRGKSIIASLMGSMIPATSSLGVGSALKAIPVIGTALGTLTMSGVSAGATYAIGKVFIQHFASGGTLLDFNPPDYREFIKIQKEKWSRGSEATPPAAQSSPPTRGGSGKASDLGP